jgi:hypothetical protein
LIYVLQRRFLSTTVGRASREVRRFSHERAVFVAPVDDKLVLVQQSPS